MVVSTLDDGQRMTGGGAEARTKIFFFDGCQTTGGCCFPGVEKMVR
jgi:hypothetical protein